MPVGNFEHKTYNMKRLLVLISALAFLTTCNQEKNNFENNEWILHYLTYDKDYNYQEKERTFFRNDSIVSFSELLGKKITFPIIRSDSILIIKQQITISNKENKNKRDTIVIDTMLYDFRNVCNKPILVLKGLDSDYMTILTCKNENEKVLETNNFLSITNFRIGGLSIGDTIEQSSLIDIKDCDDYDEKGLIEGNLTDNENIKLKLINKRIIYSIEQSMIDEDAIENIVNVVSRKVKIKIDTIDNRSYNPFYEEGFRWETEELEILLSKKDMTQYYLDMLEKENNEYMRFTYAKLAQENNGKDNYWVFKYDNLLIQTVLKYYQEKKPVSTIIE